MMMTCWKRDLVFMLIFVAALTVGVSRVTADEKKESMPKSVEVVPLRDLLAVIHEKHPGRVLDVELEQEEYGDTETWVYEIKMFTRRGRVYELEYDAVTLKLLNVKGRGHRH